MSQDGPDRDEVGSLGEEAAKLLGVLSQWASELPGEPPADPPAEPAPGGAAAGPAPGPAPGLGEQLAAALHRVDEHVDTGAAECRYCPVCRVVHAVRQTSPEVREHLVSAAGSLLEAAAGLLATQVPEDRGARSADDAASGTAPSRVERIDLDEQAWDDDSGPVADR